METRFMRIGKKPVLRGTVVQLASHVIISYSAMVMFRICARIPENDYPARWK